MDTLDAGDGEGLTLVLMRILWENAVLATQVPSAGTLEKATMGVPEQSAAVKYTL